MTAQLRFLTPSRVHCLHQLLTDLKVPLTQPSMLSSACESPSNLCHYTQEKDLCQLGACLAEKIARNHPFQDGNKRTSLFAADVFMRLNGVSLKVKDELGHDALASAQVDIVTERWSREQLGDFYRSLSARVAADAA